MIWNPWKEIKRLRAELQHQTELANMWRTSTLVERKITDGLRNELLKVVAEEKPTSNATVKRMARIAREALAG
jgi:hypothetical protein